MSPKTRFKNLAAAADELVALWYRQPEAAELLAPIDTLIEDQSFWAHQVAAPPFTTGEGPIDSYRLLDCVDEVLVVAERFHLSRLSPCSPPPERRCTWW